MATEKSLGLIQCFRIGIDRAKSLAGSELIKKGAD